MLQRSAISDVSNVQRTKFYFLCLHILILGLGRIKVLPIRCVNILPKFSIASLTQTPKRTLSSPFQPLSLGYVQPEQNGVLCGAVNIEADNSFIAVLLLEQQEQSTISHQ